jgi:hypothetical protein
MRAASGVMILVSCGIAAGCARGPILPQTPAPPACTLASFESAPGRELVRPSSRRGAAGPATGAIPLNLRIADTGRWVEAAPGWSAWRYWLRAETARSIAVQIRPFALPPGAEFWLCSPDRTTRSGPVSGTGVGGVGAYRSPDVAGPELWLEVLAPAGAESQVTLVVVEAFAAPP